MAHLRNFGKINMRIPNNIASPAEIPNVIETIVSL